MFSDILLSWKRASIHFPRMECFHEKLGLIVSLTSDWWPQTVLQQFWLHFSAVLAEYKHGRRGLHFLTLPCTSLLPVSSLLISFYLVWVLKSVTFPILSLSSRSIVCVHIHCQAIVFYLFSLQCVFDIELTYFHLVIFVFFQMYLLFWPPPVFDLILTLVIIKITGIYMLLIWAPSRGEKEGCQVRVQTHVRACAQIGSCVWVHGRCCSVAQVIVLCCAISLVFDYLVDSVSGSQTYCFVLLAYVVSIARSTVCIRVLIPHCKEREFLVKQCPKLIIKYDLKNVIFLTT